MSTTKITRLSLYTAMALIIFMVESAIPPITPLPFVKLGLANIITLVVLVQYSAKDALLVLLMRIFLASLFGGQIVYMIYSLCGGLLCFLLDVIVNKILKGRKLFVTSVFGAIGHNIGQLGAAIFFVGTGVIPYFPYMVISGIITGLFTGILADTVVLRMKKMKG